jgi:hypothetical protein
MESFSTKVSWLVNESESIYLDKLLSVIDEKFPPTGRVSIEEKEWLLDFTGVKVYMHFKSNG